MFNRNYSALLLVLIAIPIAAYPLSLSDYLNQSEVTASSDQFEEILKNNKSFVQITPNAELTLIKEVVNDDGGLLSLTDFGLAFSAGDLDFDSGVTVGNTTTFTAKKVYLSPGTYNFSEKNVDGYREGDWKCDAGKLSNATFDNGELTLAFGEQAICRISNDDIAPVVALYKKVINDDGGNLIVKDFELSIDGNVVDDGVATKVTANKGFEISELDLPGYQEGQWACKDATGLTADLPSAGKSTGVELVLKPGSEVDCYIENNDIAPLLTLAKKVVNNNGGDLKPEDFKLSINGDVVADSTAQSVKANVEIIISELDLPGYTEGAWECSDSTGLTPDLPLDGKPTGTSLKLLPGSIVECRIANDDIEPQLQLVKKLTNDNGGIKQVEDFELSIDDSVVDVGSFYKMKANIGIKISELDLPGYTEGVWSCKDAAGITADLPLAGVATGVDFKLLPGSIVSCEIANNDEAPQLTLVKKLVNDEGGDHKIEDFMLSVDGALVGDSVPTLVKANTIIKISEIDLPGYDEGVWECLDKASLTPDLPSAGKAFGTDIKLAEGADVYCTISNDDIPAQLMLVKKLINDDGGDLKIADFELSIDGAVVDESTPYKVKANSKILISELDLPGYEEGEWSCKDDMGLALDLPVAGLATSTSLTLESGSNVTCSIANDDIAPQLTLNKKLTNDNGGQKTVGDFDISIDNNEVINGDSNKVKANTAIKISELVLPGYNAGTWFCEDKAGMTVDLPIDGDATSTDFKLLPGSNVFCVISNDDIAPKLTLVKKLTNDNGGSLSIDDFDVSIDDVEVTTAVATDVVANKDIKISELVLPGYKAGEWSCRDEKDIALGLPTNGKALGETLQLPPGSDVTCEIANNDIAPLLTLNKTITNLSGGNDVVADFKLSIDGLVVSAGSPVAMDANKKIVISELDLPGYTEGTWVCSDSAGLSTLPGAGVATGASFELLPGSNAVCSIENTDIAPTLTLTKTVINLDGGLQTIEDFEVSIDDLQVDSGVKNSVLSNTDIKISELDLPGYTEGVWLCTDNNLLTTGLPSTGVATGQIIRLEEGADVECSIENDDIAPQLTLVKKVTNDNGGLLDETDFTLVLGTSSVASGAVNNVKANTALSVSEPNHPGYTEGAWACVDSTNLTTGLPLAGKFDATSVTLASGAIVTCTIDNNDIAPKLTLAKTVLNNNGGDLDVSDFEISVDDVIADNGVVQTVTANKTISLTELDLPGYSEGQWSCLDINSVTTGLPADGMATGTDIVLKPGADVTCSITNDDIGPELRLVKTILNNDGGDLKVEDFDISIDDTEVTSGTFYPVVANKDIKISELDISGYTAGSWLCEDSENLTGSLPVAGTATGELFQLKPGSKATCSITNDDVAPKLTLNKTVINDNGGDKGIADFEISINGLVVDHGVPSIVKANEVIKISELDLVPYSEGTWECLDANLLTTGLPSTGVATDTQLILEPGSDVTCSIENNDRGIDLSIVKAVDDQTPNIGQIIRFTLTVTNAGPDVATNVTVNDIVPAGFTYKAGSIVGGTSVDESSPDVTGLEWTIATMPVGTPVLLNFDATVNAP